MGRLGDCSRDSKVHSTAPCCTRGLPQICARQLHYEISTTAESRNYRALNRTFFVMPSRKWQRVLMLGVGASLALGSFTFMRGQRPAGTVVPDSTAKDTIAGADSIRTSDPVRVANAVHPTRDTVAESKTVDSASTSTPASASAPAVRFRSGEDPDFATKMGWPVE